MRNFKSERRASKLTLNHKGVTHSTSLFEQLENKFSRRKYQNQINVISLNSIFRPNFGKV